MGTNMLTGHTDKHWKAVRKGVAPAFSAQHMRCALTDMAPFSECHNPSAADQFEHTKLHLILAAEMKRASAGPPLCVLRRFLRAEAVHACLRSALRSVVECCGSLARYMEEQGPRKAMDVDELLLRESMDVIGWALPSTLVLRAPIRELLASQHAQRLPDTSKLVSLCCGTD